MKILKEGNDSILIIGQADPDFHMMDRLLGGVIAIRCDHAGQRRVRLIPDLQAMVSPKTDEYASLSVDDLATKAVELGIPIHRNALREDLIKVLETAKGGTDAALAAARELAAKARPAMVQPSPIGQKIVGNGGGYEYSVHTK